MGPLTIGANACLCIILVAAAETQSPGRIARIVAVWHSKLVRFKLVILHAPPVVVVVVPNCNPFTNRLTVTAATLSGDVIVPEIDVVDVNIGLVVITGAAVDVAAEYWQSYVLDDSHLPGS